jgi:hypothetical protein
MSDSQAVTAFQTHPAVSWLASFHRRASEWYVGQPQYAFSLGVVSLFAYQFVGLTQQATAAMSLSVRYWPLFVPIPLQSSGGSAPTVDLGQIGTALCEAGLGVVITLALWAGCVGLIYKSLPDVYRFFGAKGSSKGGAQKQKSQHISNMINKWVGGVVLASLPSVLSTAGFALLSCVNSIQII